MLDSLTRIELEKAKKGYYPGGGSNVPIGYKASKSYGKHKVHTRYLFEPTEQSRHIAEAYRRYKEGSTTGEIREYLNESGVVSRNGKPIDSSLIVDILTNPFYVGKFRWGKKIYDGKHKPIVDKVLWESVQRKFKTQPHKRFRKQRRHFYLLSGLCFCGVCKGQMWGEQHRSNSGERVWRNYTCRRCKPSWSLHCDDLERLLGETLRGYNLDSATLERVSDRAHKLLETRNPKESVKYSKLEQERDKLELALERIEDRMFLDGRSDNRLSESYGRYKTRLETIRANMAIINSSDLKTLEAVDEIISIAKSIGNMYDSFGEKSKRKLLLLLIKRILVNKKRGIVEIEFDFPLTKTSNGGLPPTILDTRSLVNELITFTIHNYHTIQSL